MQAVSPREALQPYLKPDSSKGGCMMVCTGLTMS